MPQPDSETIATGAKSADIRRARVISIPFQKPVSRA
jgi:hypothetical protein